MELVQHLGGPRSDAPLESAHGAGRQAAHDRVFPTLTPPGWTATSTGAWPGTHQVMDFNIRKLGGRLDETVWGINTQLSQAEYLWNTVERAGQKPLLVKWEMSWPPTVQTGIQVEGTGPGVSNVHQSPATISLSAASGRPGRSADRATQRPWTRAPCKRCAASIRWHSSRRKGGKRHPPPRCRQKKWCWSSSRSSAGDRICT